MPKHRDQATTIPLPPPSLVGPSDLPRGFGRAALERLPIWSCSVWGLACHSPCSERGALLPHLFTLTHVRPCGLRRAVYFLCHFPSGHPDRALPGALPSGVRTFLSARPLLASAQRSSGRLRRNVKEPATSSVGVLTDAVLLELLVEITTRRIDLLRGL